MKKRILWASLLMLTSFSSCVIEEVKETDFVEPKRPKLVVGIVVDQMRYDYIYRYWDELSDEGLKKLVEKGFYCRNTHFNYIPTFTGPGHASIYTGTTPAMHGIIGNAWFDKETGGTKYCVGDYDAEPVGTSSSAGRMSPRNLLCTTIGDEMHLAENFSTKVIGISLKDRGAVLPAGHTADAAYWYNSEDGNFISSSYYMDELPEWIQAFNDQKLAEEYMNSTWELVSSDDSYDASNEDNTPYEGPLPGTEEPVFPYDLASATEELGTLGLIKVTPFGNDLITELAMAAIDGEELGKDKDGDMLFVSYSATDGVGHQFGPHSREVQDTYLRFDQNIADLLKYLDENIGKNDYLVFLTADHGAVSVPNYLISKGIPGGYYSNFQMEDTLRRWAQQELGAGDLILNVSNEQVFLNQALIRERRLDLDDVTEQVARMVLSLPGVKQVFTAQNLVQGEYTSKMARELLAGYSQKYSGDVLFAMESGWIEGGPTGTTHGSGYRYDTHVPLIFYGWNIEQGQSFRPHTITDIAPTLAALLSIQEPSCSSGNVVLELFE